MSRYPHLDPTPTQDELDRLTARMSSGKPFTYGALAADGLDKKRAADKQIQKWRKKGWIAFTREGGATVWRLTKEGIVATAHIAEASRP